MPKKNSDTEKPRVDPDDAPELTEDWFSEADLYDGEERFRRGGRTEAKERPASPRKASDSPKGG